MQAKTFQRLLLPWKFLFSRLLTVLIIIHIKSTSTVQIKMAEFKMLNNNSESIMGNNPSEKDLKPACKYCPSKLCTGLYWKNIIVSSDFSAVPFNCPMETNDENKIRSELQQLSDIDFSRIQNDFMVKYNSSFNYGSTNDHKTESIANILNYLRRGQCAIICKFSNICYKPWRFFGHDENSIYDFVQTLKERKKEELLTDDELVATPLPLKIKDISWQHTDTTLQKESRNIAHNGNTIELQAQFENNVEGAGVDFCIYGNFNGAMKQLAKVHTHCKGKRAAADWVIDISQCDTVNPSIEFDCESRDVKSKCHPIDVTVIVSGGFCVLIKDENDLLMDEVNIVVTGNDEEIFRGTLKNKTLQIGNIPECNLHIECVYKSASQKHAVRWCPGKPPYIPEIITIKQGTADDRDRSIRRDTKEN